MSQSIEDRVRWTTADIELLPDNGNRYEIIDGELFVTKVPHWRHQRVIGSVFSVLKFFLFGCKIVSLVLKVKINMF